VHFTFISASLFVVLLIVTRGRTWISCSKNNSTVDSKLDLIGIIIILDVVTVTW